METPTTQPPPSEVYPVVQFHSGHTHAVYAGLAGRDTFCGIRTQFYAFRECSTDEPVTCKRCRHSLSSRAEHDPQCRATLQIGGGE